MNRFPEDPNLPKRNSEFNFMKAELWEYMKTKGQDIDYMSYNIKTIEESVKQLSKYDFKS